MSVPCLLIIDDEPAIRKMLRVALEADGRYRVFEAENGEDGLAEIARRQPDAVLLARPRNAYRVPAGGPGGISGFPLRWNGNLNMKP